jgi:hypothetical protein
MMSKKEGKTTTDDGTYVLARLPNSSVSFCFQLSHFLLLPYTEARGSGYKDKETCHRAKEFSSKLRDVKQLH